MKCDTEAAVVEGSGVPDEAVESLLAAVQGVAALVDDELVRSPSSSNWPPAMRLA